MSFINYEVWKSKEVSEKYLSGVRGAVPLAQVQIQIMVRIVASCNLKIEKILDVGCGDGILTAGPFDVIISGFSIHHQSDDRKQELYSEIFELLKSGGLFLNLEHVSSSSDWIVLYSMNILSILCITCTFEMMLEKRGKKLPMNFTVGTIKPLIILAPVERQCEWLHSIGFQDVDCYFKVFELALFGGRKL